jgi:hypothetical protein
VGETRPPDLRADRLGLWWLLAAGLSIAVGLGATGHPLRATAAFAGTCLGAGILRATLPQGILGALVVRRRWVDATILIVLGLAIGIVGRSMNLNPHV